MFDYEALAQAKMNPAFWDFYQGGSDDEVTLRANRTAFERIRLRPHVLVDVSASALDMRTTVLGTPVSMPVLIAPTAMHCMAHPEGECATAQAAGKAGTLMVASTVSTRTLEDIAKAASGPLWFQLYIYPSLQIAEGLVRRAEAAGYRAIVLTVDLPYVGNRERDKRHNVTIPPSPFREANFEGVEKVGLEFVMLDLGKGAKRNVDDVFLSRYACYLIVQNADPSKPIVALGQTYFAVQTRRQELADELAALP